MWTKKKFSLIRKWEQNDKFHRVLKIWKPQATSDVWVLQMTNRLVPNTNPKLASTTTVAVAWSWSMTQFHCGRRTIFNLWMKLISITFDHFFFSFNLHFNKSKKGRAWSATMKLECNRVKRMSLIQSHFDYFNFDTRIWYIIKQLYFTMWSAINVNNG